MGNKDSKSQEPTKEIHIIHHTAPAQLTLPTQNISVNLSGLVNPNTSVPVNIKRKGAQDQEEDEEAQADPKKKVKGEAGKEKSKPVKSGEDEPKKKKSEKSEDKPKQKDKGERAEKKASDKDKKVASSGILNFNTSSKVEYYPPETSTLKNRTSFTTEEQLLEEEGPTIEYKNYVYPFLPANILEIRQEICGFLNTRGGRIYIGIQHPKKVVGIEILKGERKDLIQGLATEIAMKIDPIPNGLIDMQFIPVLFKNGNEKKNECVIKIIVKQGNPNTLYYMNDAAYIRDGKDTKKLDSTTANKLSKVRQVEGQKVARASDFDDFGK